MKRFYLFLFLPFISLLSIPLSQFQMPYFKYKEQESLTLFQQGVSSFNAQAYHTSRNFFLKSLELYPKFYFAKRFLADSYFFSGNIEKSLQEYEVLKNQFPFDEYIQYKVETLEKLLLYYNLPETENQKNYSFSLIKLLNHKDFGIDRKLIPIGVFEDSGFIYILTYEPAGLWIFDREYNLIKKITGTLFTNLQRPKYLFVKNKKVIISDSMNNQVVIFDIENQSLQFLRNIDTPRDVFVLQNQIFIWSGSQYRFYKYDWRGNFLGYFTIKKIEGNFAFTEEYSFTTDGEKNIFLGTKNKIHFIDQAGFEYKVFPVNLSHISKIHYFSEGFLIIENHKNLWICNREECSRIEDLDFSSKKKFEYITDAFFNQNLHITDISGNIYYFMKSSEKRKNLLINILRVESRQFPNIAIQLKISDLSKRNYLLNLNPKNFEIFENDKRIYLINTKNREMFKDRNYFLIIKDSNIDIKNFAYEKQWKKQFYEFLDNLKITDKVFLSTSDENLKILYQGNYKIEIYDILKKQIPVINPSAILKSLEQGIYFLLPHKGKRAIILISDGDNLDEHSDIGIIEYLSRIHSIPFFIMSLNKKNEILKNLSKNTGGAYFYFYENGNPGIIYQKMKQLEWEEYLITYESPIVYKPQISGKYIDVKVKLNFLQYGGMGQGGYIVP